jgi:membrane associated rhomboid family serine protease
VNTEPISIDGVAGPVVVTTNAFWGHPAISVGGVPAPRTGKRYALPAVAGGAVEATLRTAFTDPYPTIEVGGVRHRTGPSVPVVLQVLTVLPIALAAVGGAVGGLIGALALIGNWAIVRVQIPSVVKALIMLGTAVVAFVVWLVVAAAIRAAFP